MGKKFKKFTGLIIQVVNKSKNENVFQIMEQ